LFFCGAIIKSTETTRDDLSGGDVLFLQRKSWVNVYTDGAVRPAHQISGLAAVFFDEDHHLLDAAYQICPRQTNNEAEYSAVLMALDRARNHGIARLRVYTDSQILVNQVTGLASVRSPGLKRLHHGVLMRIRDFQKVRFTFIPRTRNRIADAFANEAILLWEREGIHETR